MRRAAVAQPHTYGILTVSAETSLLALSDGHEVCRSIPKVC